MITFQPHLTWLSHFPVCGGQVENYECTPFSVPFHVQVDVNKIVRNLREQRQGMIQTKVSRLPLVYTVTVRKRSLNYSHKNVSAFQLIITSSRTL